MTDENNLNDLNEEETEASDDSLNPDSLEAIIGDPEDVDEEDEDALDADSTSDGDDDPDDLEYDSFDDNTDF